MNWDNLQRISTKWLRQVYENLIENVIRHFQGPAVLTLKSRVEHSHLVLSLRDDGPGVDEKILPHLFDRFFRADESRFQIPN